MKKFWKPPFSVNEKAKKLILTMKLTVFILFLTLMQVSATVYSQATKFSFRAENKQVVEVLRQIEEKSDFRFFFLREQVDVERKVTVTARDATVEQILEELFRGEPVSYEFANEALIVLTRSDNPLGSVSGYLEGNMQQPAVSGTVTDESGQPLPGVTVVIKGTTQGTVTNAEGSYSLSNIPEDATLVFSFVGMRTQEVVVGNQTSIDVTMQVDAIGIEEVVAIGYGTQKRVNLTGAVSTVRSEDLSKVTTSNTSQLLQGQMAGILTKQSSGMPGADNATISIRGYGEPLILVDGNVRNLSSIDPETIESISVLKDASAAIYGARAGNGVILITTKRGGFEQDLSITYNGSYIGQQFTHKPKIIKNAGQHMEFMAEAQLNAGLSPTFSEEQIQNYYNGVPGYESYDWYKYAFKNWSGAQRHNLSFQGGSQNVSFYANAGITDQQGVITSDDWWYKRYNIISNVNAKISEDLSISLNLNYVNESSSSARDVIWRSLYKTEPWAPTKLPEPYSHLAPSSNTNGTQSRLVGEMNMDLEGGTLTWPETFEATIELDYNFPFIQGLSTNAGINFLSLNTRRKEIARSYDLWKWDPEIQEPVFDGRFPGNIVENMVNLQHSKFTRLRPKLELRYGREFGKHSVTGLMVGEFFNENPNNFSAQTQNLLSSELLYLSFGDRTYNELNQFVEESSRASFAGRLNYAFAGKYLLEGTFRYDASSIFPPDTRWGFFPSASAAWRISEESFMDNFLWLDNLKIRASYSETGYDANAIRYDYFAGYSVLTDPLYIIGTNANRRLQLASLPNYDMTWEKMTNYNVGIDVNMLNGKLNMVLEGFYRERSDILTTPRKSFPSTFGATISQRNLNILDNRGFELELSHLNRIEDFSYNIKGIISYARAKWVVFDEDDYTTEDEIRILQQTGNWINRSIGYMSDGIFRSQEEIDNHPIDQDQAGNTTLIPGDIKYKDINGDNVITWADQQVIGYGEENPELNFGLNLSGNYKGFSLDILLHGGSMFSGNISGFARTPFDNQSAPLVIHWEHRFHPENNPNGTLPAAFWGVRPNNDRYSDFWLRNITFLRVKNINLGYSLPIQWVQPIGIKTIRAYVSANNLAVISNLGIWEGEFDPEAGLGHDGYPPHRTITIGLSITL
jgi:TonB-linked SusC/RagA family outer membrane protein